METINQLSLFQVEESHTAVAFNGEIIAEFTSREFAHQVASTATGSSVEEISSSIHATVATATAPETNHFHTVTVFMPGYGAGFSFDPAGAPVDARVTVLGEQLPEGMHATLTNAGFSRVAVKLTGERYTTHVFTFTEEATDQEPAPAVLEGSTVTVDAVLPALRDQGTITGGFFTPEDNSRGSRAARVIDGHLWIESPVPNYYEHASTAS